MIDIRTIFTPFRMKLGRREPVQLSLELINKGEEDAMLSFNLVLGKNLSMEKGGYRTVAMEKIASLAPMAGKKFYYELWPKQTVTAGAQPIQLTVTEHYKDFNYVKKEYKKNLDLVIED